MCMPDSALAFHQPLTPSQIVDLRLAASKMTGAKRRAFEAEMTVKYCESNPLQAETTFGWSRQTWPWGWPKTHQDHVSRCAISLQWPQALRRHTSRVR